MLLREAIINRIRSDGESFNFVIQLAEPQDQDTFEQTLATIFGFDTSDQAAEAGVKVQPLTAQSTTNVLQAALHEVFVLTLPLIPALGKDTISPQELFTIAYDLRKASSDFARVDADVPTSFYARGLESAEPVPRTAFFGVTDDAPNESCDPEKDPRVWETWAKDWSLKKIRADSVWQRGIKGRGITIAIVDNGYTAHTHTNTATFDIRHEWDYLSERSNAFLDPDELRAAKSLFPGHGTAVASVAAALRFANGDVVDPMISGVAPEAKILSIRYTNCVAYITGWRLYRAMKHLIAVKQADPDAVHIVSLSTGGLGYWWLHEVFKEAVDNNLIVVAAAGNVPGFSPVKPVVYPAAFPECIGVAAIDFSGNPWPCTSRGSCVTVSAPGGQVWRATIDSDTLSVGFAPGSGTSFATPCVAGVAALWLEHHGLAKLLAICQQRGIKLQDLFKEVLTQTAQIPEGFDAAQWKCDFGAGIVDAEAVIAYDLEADRTNRTIHDSGALSRLTAQAVLSMRDMVTNLITHAVEARDSIQFPNTFGFNINSPSPAIIDQATRQTFAQLLHVDETQVDAVVDLYGNELLYIMYENPGVLDSLVQEVVTKISQPVSDRRGIAEINEQNKQRSTFLNDALNNAASPALKQLMRGQPNRRAEPVRFQKIKVPIVIQDPLTTRHPNIPPVEHFIIDLNDTEADVFLDGPISRRVAVLDFDPDTGALYPGAKLLRPTGRLKYGHYFVYPHPEHDYTKDMYSPEFIQLNVFATIYRTLDLFEGRETMGREIPWAFDSPQLLVVPRAGIWENAFYERSTRSLQFFFFPHADEAAPNEAEKIVYTALSRDIVAHETGHAIIDGIAPDLYDAVTPQSLALHEAIADLTALLMAFDSRTLRPAVLAETNGSIERSTAFSSLADEFGMAINRGRTALRELYNELTLDPDSSEPLSRTRPHELSQVMSGALYQVMQKIHKALIEQYKKRPRFASMPDPAFSASGFALMKGAARFKRMVFRALDYLPPGNVSFADYGRALIAVDEIAYPDDPAMRNWITQEFMRRHMVSDVALLSDYKVEGFPSLPENVDIQQLHDSDWAAYHFVNEHRGLLGIPDNVPFTVHPRLRVVKKYDHDEQRMECILKVSWNHEETFESLTQAITVGTTLVIDWSEKKRILARLTWDKSEQQRADRAELLRLWINTGVVRFDDDAIGPDGQVIPSVIKGERIGQAIRVQGTGRALHILGGA